MKKSFGLLEVKGLSAAYYALDSMLKSANVDYVRDEKKLGAGLVTIIIEGSISAVKTAVDCGKKEASNINKVLTAASLDNPHHEIISFIYKNKTNKKQTNEIEKNNKQNLALGLIEIYGFAAALLAADSALKTSNVSLLGLDKTKGKAHTPGLIMFLKIGGKVDSVKLAVKAALQTVSPLTGTISHSIISQPDKMINRLIKEGI